MLDESKSTEIIQNVELFLERDYKKCIQTLNKIGIISILPYKEALGVIGLDGKE